MDRLQKEGEGGWSLWDYKTGRRYLFERKRNKGLLFQPYIYAHLLEGRGGSCHLFRYVFLLHMEDGRQATMDLDVSPPSRKERLDRAVELVKKAREGWFPWHSQVVDLEETEDKCRYCAYRTLCRREDKPLGW